MMRKDRTKKLKLIHNSHFGQKENIQNEPDDDTDYGNVNSNKLAMSVDWPIIS